MHERLANARRRLLLAAIAVAAVACGNSAPPTAKASAIKTPAGERSPTADTRAPSAPKPRAVPEGDKPLSEVKDLVPGADCPEPGSSGNAAIAAAGSALIPLKVGLTLSHIWKANADDYEHECLLQISKIDGRQITTTSSCPTGNNHLPLTTTRRICWTDVIDSYLYITQGAKTLPETLVGALKFNLSVASFAALKTQGKVRHRYLQIDDQNLAFSETDLEGTLVSDGPTTFKLIINDKMVEVPTIEANYVNFKTNDIIRVKVLDDARFPLMLDYFIPSFHRFFITNTKVSFPTANELEQHLAVEKHTDVYGIYFNFASDELRSESEPVLHEIADALKTHPEWTLIINGHTDNIGGDALNLDLSRRRATAVRKALVERYKIEDSRLTTNGFGASQPKESNDSDRGRALNRRVELVRP
jgi:flagellar motor protein MotB